MNTLLLSLFAVAAVSASAPQSIQCVSEDDDIVIIIIHKDKGDGINRDPVPIDGYVDAEANLVTLSFSESLGTVIVQFENLTTGYSSWSGVIGSGSVMIPLSCTSGSWRVTFTLSDGTTYTGEFVL